MNREAVEPLVEYLLNIYYKGLDKYGNQVEVSKDSFEKRWNKARAILEKDIKVQFHPSTGPTIYKLKLIENIVIKRI